jgi:hypothetical protein
MTERLAHGNWLSDGRFLLIEKLIRAVNEAQACLGRRAPPASNARRPVRYSATQAKSAVDDPARRRVCTLKAAIRALSAPDCRAYAVAAVLRAR